MHRCTNQTLESSKLEFALRCLMYMKCMSECCWQVNQINLRTNLRNLNEDIGLVGEGIVAYI